MVLCCHGCPKSLFGVYLNDTLFLLVLVKEIHVKLVFEGPIRWNDPGVVVNEEIPLLNRHPLCMVGHLKLYLSVPLEIGVV